MHNASKCHSSQESLLQQIISCNAVLYVLVSCKVCRIQPVRCQSVKLSLLTSIQLHT